MLSFELAHTGSTDPASFEGASWIPAVVPGGVHESLIAAGVIDHPYYADNEASAAWIEDAIWWYRGTLDVPALKAGQRCRLVFHGLDSVATVYLDGVETARHETMFRPLSLDLADLAPGPHEVLVRFDPPLAGLEAPAGAADAAALTDRVMAELRPDGPSAEASEPGPIRANTAKTLRRKPLYGYGWDFAPHLPSVGIWQPVEVVVSGPVGITGVYARTVALSVEARTAEVFVEVETDGEAAVGIELVAPDGRRFPDSFGRFTVDDAQFWWTHDLGEQPLYDVVVTLTGPDGVVLDTRHDRIGLRTITVEQPADEAEGGQQFRFVLNGTPIFARGANWVPASMLPGSVGDERYRALVKTARHGAMNMLRVWGGGLYEPDVFFDACDEEGVLVWQDFMFACNDYDDTDPVLRAEVELEAEFQVKRLRNHASLALWAGNNEVQALHMLAHGDTEEGDWGWHFFMETLPAAVARHGGATFYWPGSPFGEENNVNGTVDGDRHAWEVWHGLTGIGAGGPTEFASRGEAVHFSRYAHDTGKFISEFGIHASPDLNTLERWTPPGSLALGSEQFNHRNKDNPKDKGNDLMEIETGLPADLAEYVAYSMACQAEGLKFGIEHYRRRQPHCSGTLVWQFNDPWPGTTWSVVDYDLTPKAGYWFMQQVHQPVIATFTTGDDGSVELWLTNSSRTSVDLELRVEVSLFAGGSALDERVHVTSTPDSSVRIWSAPAARVQAGADRFAHVSEAAGLIQPNRMFFGHLKDLPLTAGSVTARVGAVVDGSLQVTLTAAGYAYFVALTTPQTGVAFSRNYVELRDGESLTITVSGLPADFDPTSLQINSWGGPATVVFEEPGRRDLELVP